MLTASGNVHAQALPPCYHRPTYRDNPWTDGTLWCLELVIDDPDAGELGFTALATAPDGTLYAARPLQGQVLALTDSDGDLLPDSPRVIAGGLTLPNSLAYHDGALYIVGGAHIYRVINHTLETLVSDVPSGGGFWTGGIALDSYGQIYVSTGAPCDACEPTDPARGAVLRFDPDGANPLIIATGLRQPADLAFVENILYTVDTSRDQAAEAAIDELNIVLPGRDFGFPYCIGSTLEPDPLYRLSTDCTPFTPPVLSFPRHSAPTGLAYYKSDAFPTLNESLLVVLSGSNNQAHMEGYALAAVHLTSDGAPSRYNLLIPDQREDDREQFSLQHMNYRTSGFWPHRPFDVAVSPEGWVYVSVGGGRIYALRPL